ncbi:hypothetical protein V6N13_124261 [Hibiscus sabdariffa]|uniref:Uncharacterized protein n=1 Tax=Hibiscus sabdariffa TaxID=183260 RepID=A0ABR2S0Y7_9ROSI
MKITPSMSSLEALLSKLPSVVPQRASPRYCESQPIQSQFNSIHKFHCLNDADKLALLYFISHLKEEEQPQLDEYLIIIEGKFPIKLQASYKYLP